MPRHICIIIHKLQYCTGCTALLAWNGEELFHSNLSEPRRQILPHSPTFRSGMLCGTHYGADINNSGTTRQRAAALLTHTLCQMSIRHS